MPKLINLTGQRFGRLAVIERAGAREKAAAWLCRCDCGKVITATGSDLRKGNTQSCGCLRREKMLKMVTVRGGRRTRLYGVWCAMKDRCNNPKNKDFPDYGGRGITVCAKWLHDFGAFQDWAMASGYDETAPRGACTIDRIDNDKGYSPDNCRWVDMKAQASNRKRGAASP